MGPPSEGIVGCVYVSSYISTYSVICSGGLRTIESGQRRNGLVAQQKRKKEAEAALWADDSLQGCDRKRMYLDPCRNDRAAPVSSGRSMK